MHDETGLPTMILLPAGFDLDVCNFERLNGVIQCMGRLYIFHNFVTRIRPQRIFSYHISLFGICAVTFSFHMGPQTGESDSNVLLDLGSLSQNAYPRLKL